MQNISVVIPTYNRGHCIKNAIESVFRQTYPIRELIVADDGSSDDTEQVICAMHDERIHYYRLPENRGAGGARNYGVSKARGELIAFQDSDDEWTEDKIEKQVNYLERHPEFGMIYNAFSIRLSNSDALQIFPTIQGERKLEGNLLKELLVQNTIDAPTMLISKKVFCEVGGFDESMRSLEDWDLAIRVARKYPIGFVPEVLLHSTNTLDGVSSNLAAYYQSRCYMLRKYRKEYLQTNTFNVVVESLLRMATEEGIQKQVESMLVAYLSN